MSESKKKAVNKKKHADAELLSFIPRGKSNAVSVAYLSECLSLDRRAIIRRVRHARINGDIILSSKNAGYYQPANNKEIAEFYNNSRAESIGRLSVIKGVRKYLKGEGLIDSHGVAYGENSELPPIKD